MLMRIERVHVEEGLLMEGERDRIDPDKWRPLIMSFQQSTASRRESSTTRRSGRFPNRCTGRRRIFTRPPEHGTQRELAKVNANDYHSHL